MLTRKFFAFIILVTLSVCFICRERSPHPPAWPRLKHAHIAAAHDLFFMWKKMNLRHVSIACAKKISISHVCWNTANSTSYGWSWTFQNLFLTLQTFIIYLEFVYLTGITFHLDRRTICQKVNNFSIVNRNYHIYVVRCSSTKSILHVKASAAAVELSPASQE